MPISIEQIKRRTNDQTYKKGLELFKEAGFFDLAQRGDLVEGFYQGSDLTPYHTQLEIENETIKATHCTCGYKRADDCKHVVGLLMTYLTEPERFAQRGAPEDPLLQLDKEELIELVRQMVMRYPDLQILIENPQEFVPAQIDVSPFRKQFHEMLRHEIKSRNAAEMVHELLGKAETLEQQENWTNACEIYIFLIQEALAPDHFAFDEAGNLMQAVGEVIDHLIAILRRELAPGLRSQALMTLLDAYIWENSTLWQGFTALVPDVILTYATPHEIGLIRPKLEVLAKKSQEAGKLQLAKTYRNLLSDLEVLETQPHLIFQHLASEGHHTLLFEKHLLRGDVQAAANVARNELLESDELLPALISLWERNETETALNIGEAALRSRFQDELANWLVNQYRVRDDYAAALRVQRLRMAQTPSLGNYLQLREFASILGQWQEIRPKILQWLKDNQHHETLTDIYLEEQLWGQAWESLAEAKLSEYRYRELEFEVAEKSRFALPERALAVYRERIQTHIEAKKRDNYQIAVQLLGEVRFLYQQLGQLAAWEEYLQALNQQYSRLQAFQDELSKAEW